MSKPQDSNAADRTPMELSVLAREMGVSVELLRTFSAISDVKNKRIFTAEAAQVAFSEVRPRKVEF